MTDLINKAVKIKQVYENIWLEIENVTAVGTGTTTDGRTCLVISLSVDDPATREIFPPEIEDVPVIFRISGKAEAL